MESYPAIIIGIDPGQTTGVSVLYLDEEEYHLAEVLQLGDPDNVWKPLKQLIEKYKKIYDNVTVLCESFELRPDVVNPDETPKYIIKDLNRYVENEHEIRYQLASQAKVGVPPARSGARDRLYAFKLYSKGQRHANDATRHCVAFAVGNLRHRPLIVRGWGLPGKK